MIPLLIGRRRNPRPTSCIGLTCAGTTAAELTKVSAVVVYDDPAALSVALHASAIAAVKR
ncbi:hypothetical protein [Actinoplanes sp. NPDC051851]|uniref:hypothetical protein n=1 Tax=Actinoplanes sp. NPDC051851 TaxID=3154753 RepID=UPI0034345CC7